MHFMVAFVFFQRSVQVHDKVAHFILHHVIQSHYTQCLFAQIPFFPFITGGLEREGGIVPSALPVSLNLLLGCLCMSSNFGCVNMDVHHTGLAKSTPGRGPVSFHKIKSHLVQS